VADILIIDGDSAFTARLEQDLGSHGLTAACCNSLARAMGMLHTGEYRVVVLGDDLSERDSLDYLAAIRDIPSFPEVIVVSRNRDPDAAERAIRNGAWDYIAKPPNVQRLVVLTRRVMDYQRERKSARPPVALKRGGIVGNSRLLQASLDCVAVAASTETSVLIVGETGTGKELFARAVHENSPRSRQPFVVVDCAALPDALAESLLFGHERGAFTSADSHYIGLVRQADKGTLFLDEVGELPLSIQRVFLRVLEGRSFRPVGATREVTSDFRILAATNRDMEAMVANGDFRRDLFYRLHGSRIQLPPLRDIPEDINELTCYFIRRHCRRFKVESKGFSPDFLDVLMQYQWPGNIRELMNTIEQAISLAGRESILYPRHLPWNIRSQVARHAMEEQPEHEHACVAPCPGDTAEAFPDLKSFRATQLAALETQYMRKLMDLAAGDIRRACELSGLSRARLYALLKQYDIARGR
jgi:two-component system NtrC family response regulator